MIVCDACKSEISGPSIKINAEFVDNITGNVIEEASTDKEPVWGKTRDYCYTCFLIMNSFITKMISDEEEESRQAAADLQESADSQEADLQENADSQAAAGLKIEEKPIKTETELTSPNDKNILPNSDNMRPQIRNMIVNGFDNDAIAEKLKCPKKYIYDERSKLKNKMKNCTQEVMVECIYAEKLSRGKKENDYYCNYMQMEGHSRGCDAERCIRFKKRRYDK